MKAEIITIESIYQELLRENGYKEEEYSGERACELMKMILRYAKTHESFDTTFVKSVRKHYRKYKSISHLQYNALCNIFYGFKLNEKQSKKLKKA